MACGENCRTVFHRHTENTRLKVVRQPQLVADGVRQHIFRRHFAGFRVAADGLHIGVAAAIHLHPFFKETITADAVQRGRRARIDTRVTDARHRRNVVDHRVFARITLVDEALEATLDEILVIIIEVVPSHLIDNQSDHEFRTLNFLACPRSGRHEQQRQKNKCFLFHKFGFLELFDRKDTIY